MRLPMATAATAMSISTTAAAVRTKGLAASYNRSLTAIAGPKPLFGAPSTTLTSATTSCNSDQPPPLSRLPLKALLRGVVLNTIMATPLLRRPAMGIMAQAVSPRLAIFDPDRNPLLRTMLMRTAYEQFCAGQTPTEVKKTVSSIKGMGFQGVILCYGREALVSPTTNATGHDTFISANPSSKVQPSPSELQAVQQWRQGLLDTLSCLGPGDFLAVKFTGAGPIALEALKASRQMPQVIQEALDTICQETAERGSRLWLDAEQTALQPTVDEWTIGLMRRYNRNGVALVSNTIQAYLKSAPANTDRHLRLAAEEGWSLGIKLVRGAYIESDDRTMIHDTIEQTHHCFDSISEQLIEQTMPPSLSHLEFPSTSLFIASHNAASVTKAQALQSLRVYNKLPTINLEYGQLQGMADEVSLQLVQEADRIKAVAGSPAELGTAPHTFKYLTWGTLDECLGYLFRRAVENKGAVERTSDMARALRQELWRRIKTAVLPTVSPK